VRSIPPSAYCDVDPDQVSAAQPNDDEGIKQVEANGRNVEALNGVLTTIKSDGIDAFAKGNIAALGRSNQKGQRTLNCEICDALGYRIGQSTRKEKG
jgi:hypothetical protein